MASAVIVSDPVHSFLLAMPVVDSMIPFKRALADSLGVKPCPRCLTYAEYKNNDDSCPLCEFVPFSEEK